MLLFQRQARFNANRVLPAVAEVVLVAEALVDAEFEIGHSDQFWIGRLER